MPSVTVAERDLSATPFPSSDEAGRLRALARYTILDTPPDEGFDQLADLARGIAGTDIAGIAFFGSDRVWFKSLLGADPEELSADQLLGTSTAAPTGTGVLGRAIGAGALVAVPCVTSDGYTLGCLFVADSDPVALDERTRHFLRSLAEQAVRLLELRRTLLSYHTVVDKAGHVVFHLDQSDRLVSLTPTWSQLSGFGVVRSLGARLSDFLHTEDEEGFGDWLDEVRGTTTPPVLQCRLARLTGDEVMVELLARPLVDEENRVLGVVGVIADVSARHAREVEAQHLSKLEALGRLSAGLAHEINTPIQFVGDNTRFLAECYETMLTLVCSYRDVLSPDGNPMSWAERQVEIDRAEGIADIDYLSEEVPLAIQQSLDGVERVASLVRAMKTFSHPGSREQSPANLNEALRATVTVAQNQFRYFADVELDFEDLPPVVCNLGDLNQVFLNLVVNAADAIEETGRHGKITIATRTDDDDVVVSVSDTGGGMPEHLKLQIFEPFFTTKEVGRGTGQGLALVRAIVNKHEGTISVDSHQGIGTTFEIRLPIQGCTAQEGPAR
ncbi:GHKL domain-containing protein [Nocardioides seonyuensis]|uniref:histidine kinase n=1 Tax=Nocardioides seonyuensis TaxID=2518371 RepID=A0A4P7IHH0_9ACTN|nr:GHKL domain-containing protein [Nocardioides seonyuensis]